MVNKDQSSGCGRRAGFDHSARGSVPVSIQTVLCSNILRLLANKFYKAQLNLTGGLQGKFEESSSTKQSRARKSAESDKVQRHSCRHQPRYRD